MLAIEILCGLLLLIAIGELASYLVLGGFIKESYLPQLRRKISKNIKVEKDIVHFGLFDFASTHTSLFSKWYLQGIGRIKRNSPMSKMLDETVANRNK